MWGMLQEVVIISMVGTNQKFGKDTYHTHKNRSLRF